MVWRPHGHATRQILHDGKYEGSHYNSPLD
jgi:hypothetical protein